MLRGKNETSAMIKEYDRIKNTATEKNNRSIKDFVNDLLEKEEQNNEKAPFLLSTPITINTYKSVDSDQFRMDTL